MAATSTSTALRVAAAATAHPFHILVNNSGGPPGVLDLLGNAHLLSRAHDEGKKVVYTFVPGNLNELVRSFGLLPVLPEINALQSGMRKLSGDYIAEAEKQGHSEDVCTYVKCDIGMLKKGNIGPTGKRLPTLTIDTRIGFRSAADRAAFADDLTAAVLDLAARYHHDDGRPHRLLVAAHPLPEENP